MMQNEMTQNKMIVIGLTGNIGSGKSTVSVIMSKLGAYIIDTDIISREVLEPGEPAYIEVVDYFGRDILNGSGKLYPAIDRKKLGALVFSDKKMLQKLMDITYKYILKITRERIKRAAESGVYKYAVVDAPLLVEAGMHEESDEVWVVWADDCTRLERIIKRDTCTAEDALLKMANQKTTEELLRYADFAIENNGNIQLLEDTVRNYCCGHIVGLR